MASLLAITLGVTTTAIVARGALRAYRYHGSKDFFKNMKKYMAPPSNNEVHSDYFKGGFNTTMDKKEAQLVLGLKDYPPLTSSILKEHHRRIMLLNHPDRGGSPYLASKINEAKSILEKYTSN